MIDIFTDGACSGNPGPGGWGAILRSGGHEKELSGGEKVTTNNRMELMAVIEGLNALKAGGAVTVHTDSRYVMDGASKWLSGWKKKGWLTAAKKPVVNRDLWEELDAEANRHQVQWLWTKGHASHADNNRADELASLAAKTQSSQM